MERDDRRRADALDRYWDAALRDEAPPRPDDVDDVAAAVIARLAEHPDLPRLDAAQQRVRRRIIAPAGATEEPVKTTARPDAALAAGGRVAPRRLVDIPTATPHRWRYAPFAVAALLLLAIGLDAVARGRGWWPGQEKRNTIPAAVAPASVAEEILLNVAVDAADVPSGTTVAGGLTHITIPAGDQSTWAGNCCPGLRVYYVVAGRLGVFTRGPVHVVHAGETLAVRPQGLMRVVDPAGIGTSESRPVGTEINLEPGDALVSRNEFAFEANNPGSAPVELLMVDLTTLQNDVPSSWMLHAVSGAFDIPRPAGAVALHLRRVDLAPEAVMPAPPDAVALMAVALVENESGATASEIVTPRADGAITNSTEQTLTVHVLTLEPVAGATAMPAAGSPTS